MENRFALENPLTRILNKPKEEFTREDLIKVFLQQQCELITFHYFGLDGKLKELKIPITNRRQIERILADGERADGSSLFKGLVDVSLSDVYVIPIYKTAFLNPFDSKSLDFICRYVTAEGNLASIAPDNVARNAHRLFKETTGYDLYALGELEFFLIGTPESKLYAAEKQRGYHASSPFVKSGSMLNEMVRHIAMLTGEVKYAHSEVGSFESVRSDLEEIRGKQAEQLEIEFLPVPIDEAADNLVLSKWLIRNIALKYNAVATFSPKLEEGIAGNGYHIHMELRKDGKNAMTEAGKLTPDARKLIGGLCHYADSLTSFGNTTSAAYLRLVPNQEAPTRICWSDRNRSAMIRVPLGWNNVADLASQLNPQQKEKYVSDQGRQTVELRSPDGSAITHLLLAGITMAAQWGLTHPDSSELSESLYVTGNIFKDKELLQRLPSLPKSCVESARVLRGKRELYEREDIFPPSIIEYVAKLLEEENDEKMNKYLADLPADDRLAETRKIMHKDLHRH